MMTRAQKLATFTALSKKPGIKTGREFEDSLSTARLLIDHPHSYRTWRIVGPSSIPGFFHLESSFRLDHYTDGEDRAMFHLCLPESDFERIQ